MPNTPKYLLLWDALELGQRPLFAHLPLLVNESRQRLSKRRDKVALEDYRDEGYLSEAMFNYLALLGWSARTTGKYPVPAGTHRRVQHGERQVITGLFRPAKISVRQCDVFAVTFSGHVRGTRQRMVERPLVTNSPPRQERARTLADVYSMVDFLYLPEVKFDQADWDKARRQQPAFAALLETAEGRYEECEWDATGIREATLEAGAAVGVAALGRRRPPCAWPLQGARWAHLCSSPSCCWAAGARWPEWHRLASVPRPRTRPRRAGSRRIGRSPPILMRYR